MAINVSVQYYGGLLPDIILLTQCYHHQRTRLNAVPCRGFVFGAYETVYNIITALFDMYYIVSVFVWCPCMANNNNVSVQYNGGLLPDIVPLTQCY